MENNSGSIGTTKTVSEGDRRGEWVGSVPGNKRNQVPLSAIVTARIRDATSMRKRRELMNYEFAERTAGKATLTTHAPHRRD